MGRKCFIENLFARIIAGWVVKQYLPNQITRNRFYDSLMALIETIIEWLERLPYPQVCSLKSIDDSQLVLVQRPFSQ